MTKDLNESETEGNYGEFLFRSISVTKYNPKYYGDEGYSRCEWTDYSEIGKTIKGKEFLLSEYIETEGKYILACYLFIKRFVPHINLVYLSQIELEINNLKSTDSDNEKTLEYVAQSIKKGRKIFSLLELGALVQLVLRNHAWFVICLDDSHKIHFGYDYYMYFEKDRELLKSDNKFANDIKKIGLFLR